MGSPFHGDTVSQVRSNPYFASNAPPDGRLHTLSLPPRPARSQSVVDDPTEANEFLRARGVIEQIHGDHEVDR